VKKQEIKRLAKDMAASYLRGLLDVNAIENGLEMRSFYLDEQDVEQLEKAIQEIIEKLEK